MLRLARARLRPRRLVPTALAVILAVGFVAGTLIFATTVRAAVYDEYARAARHVGTAVTVPSGRLPRSIVDTLGRSPGIGAVAGRMREPLPVLDRDGRLLSPPGDAINTGPVPALREYDLRSGRLPATPSEAAVDARTAERVGSTIEAVGAGQQRHRLTVVGVVAIRGTGSTVVLTDAGLTAVTGATGYRSVVATGVFPGKVPGAVVRTGDQYRADLAKQAFAQVDGLITGLGLFAAVAVLVAAFVIANTFTILVAQRTRETALLRCIGAGRGQVLRLVLAESALTGLAGSVAGVVLGVGVAYGLGRIVAGFGLPAGHLRVAPAPVLVAVALGVVVTVGAAAWPAHRASRTAPIAALRPVASRGRRWAWVALPVALAGIALTVAGPHTGSTQLAMVVVMAGGVVVFGALLMVAPALFGRLFAVPRAFGVPIRLAAANARQHPGRTAATTSALLVGVALMAGGSTIAATVTRTADAQLDAAFPVDYVLSGDLPGAAASSVAADPAFNLAAAVRQGTATTAGGEVALGTVDPSAIGTAYRPEVLRGSVGDLRAGTAVVSAQSDATRAAAVGSPIRLVAGHRAITVTVAAVVQSSTLLGDVLLTGGDFTRLDPAVAPSALLVRTAPGVPAATARAHLDTALRPYPLVQVSDLATVRADRHAAVNQIVAVIAVLLGFALVIALVGIANTLSLSVLERQRESAVVRALGLTRGGLAATLLAEALLMSAAGSLAGVAFGLTYGWLTARAALGAAQTLLSVPVGELVAFVGIAAAAAVLAALLPARRAARVPVVAALAAE